MVLGLKRRIQKKKNTQKTYSEVLVKAENHRDKKFYFDQYGHGRSGDSPEDSPNYTHETHEKMFAWHVPDEGKKKQIRKDAYEQAKGGSTKGHVAAHGLLTVLDDFKKRLEEAEGDKDLTDQVLSEMHDWLAYVHAQHDQHGLHKDAEFKRAYTDAHTHHMLAMQDQSLDNSDDDDDDGD